MDIADIIKININPNRFIRQINDAQTYIKNLQLQYYLPQRINKKGKENIFPFTCMKNNLFSLLPAY